MAPRWLFTQGKWAGRALSLQARIEFDGLRSVTVIDKIIYAVQALAV